jgi:hypothetical protein
MDNQNLDSLSTQQSMPDAHGLSPASESQLQAFPESTTQNCPRGFVWWQQPPNSLLDPSKYRHHDHGPPDVVNGTHCAISCSRSPYLTEKQYDDMYSSSTFVIPCLLLLISIPLFISFVLRNNRRWKKNYLLVVYYFFALPVSIMNAVTHFLNYLENGSTFCVDDAMPYGPNAPVITMCLFQWVVTSFAQWATFIAYACVNIELVSLIVAHKSLASRWRWFLLTIFGIPLVRVVVAVSMAGQLHAHQAPFDACNFDESSMTKYFTLLFLGSSVVCLFVCFLNHVKRACSAASGDESRLVLGSVPMLFSTMAMIAYALMFVIRGHVLVAVDLADSTKLLEKQISCIFEHYDGVSDQSWITACSEGIEPVASMVWARKYAAFLYDAQHLFVVLAFMPLALKKWLKKRRSAHHHHPMTPGNELAVMSNNHSNNNNNHHPHGKSQLELDLDSKYNNDGSRRRLSSAEVSDTNNSNTGSNSNSPRIRFLNTNDSDSDSSDDDGMSTAWPKVARNEAKLSNSNNNSNINTSHNFSTTHHASTVKRRSYTKVVPMNSDGLIGDIQEGREHHHHHQYQHQHQQAIELRLMQDQDGVRAFTSSSDELTADLTPGLTTTNSLTTLFTSSSASSSSK